MQRNFLFSIAFVVAMFGFVIACGGDEPEVAPTPDISSLLDQAVNRAMDAAPQGASAEEIQKLVEDAVASSAQQGVSAAEVEAAIERATQGLLDQAVSRALQAAPQGASVEDIQRLVQEAVAASAQPGVTAAEVEAAVQRASQGQLSAAQVRSIVAESISNLPAPTVNADELRPLVQQAVQQAVPTGTSADEIRQMVEAAVAAATEGSPTMGDLQAAIADSVAQATEGRLTSDDVQRIVAASMQATEEALQVIAAAAEAARMAAEEAQEIALANITTYNEAPMLAAMVANNELPPVEDRLPKDPVVMHPSGREAQIGQYGGTMRRCHRSSDHWTYGYIAPEGMNRFAQDGRTLIPSIAKAWWSSEDNRVWTFKIREGLKWSDGAPFTMEDFLFEYEDVILNEDLMPAPPSKLVTGEGEDKAVVQFEVLDDTTIQFRFKHPFADFPDVAAQLNRARSLEQTLWAPKHYLKNFHIKYNPKANELAEAEGFSSWIELFQAKDEIVLNPDRPTMRPWMLRSKMTDQKWIAVRNPYYYAVDPEGNQLPYIDRIEWTNQPDPEVAILEVLAGNIDFDRSCGIGVAKYPILKENEASGDYRVIQAYFPGGARTVNMNQSYEGREGKWIRNKDFRLALGLAIDRDAINEILFLGLAEKMNPVPQADHPYYPGDEYKYANTEYSPEKANELLDKIGLSARDGEGYRVESDGYRPHLLFMTTRCDDATEIILSGWEAVGLKSTCNAYERAVTYAKSSDNTMMFAGGMISNSPFIFSVPSHTAPVDHKLVNNMGAEYAKWHESGGVEGIEPTQDIKDLIQLHVDGAAAETDEERAMYAQQILQAHATEQWQLAILGNWPQMYVAHNDLANVPDRWVASFINRYYAVTFPEQMWFKSEHRRAGGF